MNSEPLDLSKNNFISNFPLTQPGAGSMQLNPSISAVSPITQLPSSTQLTVHQQHLLNLISKLTSHRQQSSHIEDDNEKINSDLVRKRRWDQVLDQSDVTDSKKLKADSEIDQTPGSSAGLDLTKSKTDEMLSGFDSHDSGNHSGDEGKLKRIFNGFPVCFDAQTGWTSLNIRESDR